MGCESTWSFSRQFYSIPKRVKGTSQVTVDEKSLVPVSDVFILFKSRVARVGKVAGEVNGRQSCDSEGLESVSRQLICYL